jgi:acetoacetyl-CoA synthetase
MTVSPLWTPPRARQEQANLSAFAAELVRRGAPQLSSYPALQAYSLAEPNAFWSALWDFGGVKASRRGDRFLVPGGSMREAHFFPDARLNYAENMLARSDDTPALIFRGEDKVARTMTWRELHAKVARLHHVLAASGLKPHDRVAAVVPNHPDTIVSFLAVASLGGILDRFGQIEPRVLITCDGYFYNGKTIPLAGKIAAVLKQLPSVEEVIIIDYIGAATDISRTLPNATAYDDFISRENAEPIDYAQLPFDHPLYILYSSGTTGIPKCIVHRAGGILLKHLSEHLINCDLKRDDRLFYFTTCGWMMWNWLVSGLAAGATLLLYDGSPFYPNERALFDFAAATGMTIFGTSAKYIDAVKKSGLRPAETHDLSSLRTMLSTGSPLAPESFDFVYRAIKPDIHLASISGGTDICGCFVGGNPLSPVWRGEIQGPMIGTAVDVFDDEGLSVVGVKGELVCTKPFPSMPVMFWNDPDGLKYHNAYFARFPGIWCHGDFAEWTEHGGIIIHGRSDATLNPGGVRIGTAEIYAQVEQIPEVIEALAIGQDWDNDIRVVLFVRLRQGLALDEPLIGKIKTQIRLGASPRHVPVKVIAVADIPRTKSGKITELAVRDVVHGRPVKNKEALANPEALDLFADLSDLKV